MQWSSGEGGGGVCLPGGSVCLPVGCLPARGVSACQGCVYLPGVCLPGGVSAYRGLSTCQGVSARGGVNNKELISVVKRILKLFNPFNHPLYFYTPN